MKVEVRQEPGSPSATGPRPQPIKRCAPFYRSRMRKNAYVHRVRSGTLYVRAEAVNGMPAAWVCVSLWCGMHGSLRKHGDLYHEPPEVALLCATCEGRAVGVGEPSAAFLTQIRDLQFAPGGRFQGTDEDLELPAGGRGDAPPDAEREALGAVLVELPLDRPERHGHGDELPAVAAHRGHVPGDPLPLRLVWPVGVIVSTFGELGHAVLERHARQRTAPIPAWTGAV